MTRVENPNKHNRGENPAENESNSVPKCPCYG